jgi:hypothetical protein
MYLQVQVYPNASERTAKPTMGSASLAEAVGALAGEIRQRERMKVAA